MPDCKYCGKHYERNSAHYREHEKLCGAKSAPRLLDKLNLPTPKPPAPQPVQPVQPAPAPVQPVQPAPAPVRPVRTNTGISDGAKLGFKSLYIASVLVQNRMNGTLKEFDKKIYEKRIDYARMLDEILAKRGIQVNLPVELRLGVELSTDAFRSFKDRIDDPIDFNTIAQKNPVSQTQPPSARNPRKADKDPDFADIDRLFN